MFRPLSRGQRGEVFEVNGERVAVILESDQNETDKGTRETSIYWIEGKSCIDLHVCISTVSIR